ncbi:serine--tRNA ligase [Pelagibacteraceae bacterium]|nr:serine--tRNA ligase [Pelagibacteraceae bacterium]
MHNIKLLREKPDFFKKKFQDRNMKLNIDELLNLDKKNREIINKKEKLEQERKIISKNKDEEKFKKSKQISNEIKKLETDIEVLKVSINKILHFLPNIALDDVPIGSDEKFNKELRKVGKIPNFKFKPKSHYEIGKNLNLMDFDVAARTSGARFVFLKGNLAKLERAISDFMLDTHTKKFDYLEISPPLIASSDAMFGTGQLPKFENDQFEIKFDEEKNRKFLIPTAEVILTNMIREKQLLYEELPLRFVASTACFRKEAGSYGKDTKGMLRQHQFYKVELVSIVEPDKCNEELNRMTSCAEYILKELKLPYRSIMLSSGDMGFSAEKTIDLEVWIPSEKNYREISSCSSCGQFQSRRMKTKFKKKDQTDFPCTLNGSGLAVGRTLIAIMENYQDSDGRVVIPDVLRPYMNDLDKI